MLMEEEACLGHDRSRCWFVHQAAARISSARVTRVFEFLNTMNLTALVSSSMYASATQRRAGGIEAL